MPVRAKELRYAVDLAADGELRDENGVVLDVPAEWSPEHLLLAALVRCSIDGFAHHARRAGHSVTAAGSAHGTITKSGEDERYRFVDIEVQIDAQLQPRSDEPDVLVAKAERDCFVGASLAVKPRYTWRVS